MKSDLPKVLHPIGERPMVDYVVDTVAAAGVGRVIVVVGYQGERVCAALERDGLEFVTQSEQLGTGHAVVQCAPALAGFDGTVVVLSGDVPGLRDTTLADFIAFHRARSATASVMTARVPNPTGYGRVVRGGEDTLLKIVEHKDASPEELTIDEINSGLYCFERGPLFDALREIDRSNAQNEYYLTDVVEKMNRGGQCVAAWCVPDEREVAGINTVEELEAVRAFMREGGR
jgi:bifunctional UDP-N-acetylglucosamine pyrophosphorylase/glucosamine-1-phosphate N-acetyltransferase